MMRKVETALEVMVLMAVGVLLVTMVLSGLSCGGPPEGIVVEADESATKEVAQKAGFKYCNIVSDRFCQSPDGALVFHLPVDVLTATDGNMVNENVLVSNNGAEEVVIEEYYMTLTDDRGNFYRPSFHGPGENGFLDTPVGAFRIRPSKEERISFTQSLKKDARSVKSVSIFYRLQGDTEFTQVVVSYKAGSIYEVNK